MSVFVGGTTSSQMPSIAGRWSLSTSVHWAPGLGVSAGPDREVEAALDPEVDRRHAAEVLRVVVRYRAVRAQFARVRPDEFDEVRAADLLLALGQDLEVDGHLVDVADRLPREKVIRQSALRVRRAARDDRLSDPGDLVDLRREERRHPGLQVADRLDVVHLVLDERHGRADVEFADHERVAAFRPHLGLAAQFRHHRADHLGALLDALAGRADGRLAEERPGVVERLREPRFQGAVHLGGSGWLHRCRQRPHSE